MSSQGFSFPPPPPPPPPTTQHPPAYPSAQSGQWNGRGVGGRGRGRGHANRGRGGHAYTNGSRPQYPNTSGYNYPPGNYGYPAQPSATPFMSPAPYSHAQSNFQHPQNPSTYQSPPTFSHPPTPAPYQPLPGYNGSTNLTHSAPYSTPAASVYPPNIPTPQHGSSPANPVMMGSVTWGAEVQTAPGSFVGAPPNHARGARPSHSHGNHGPKPRHVNKRDHTVAFSKPQSAAPRCLAPPPVPSFGNPLPSKPPPAADATRKPKKRKRKHNQLGLTPKTEDHESSEEEEDVDEESKLASTAAPLQFTYKGRTATLQSASDIAAWIAERRKKFPTQARVEEKQKAVEEAKAAREAARREKEKEREIEKEKERARKETVCSAEGGHADPAIDAAMKAQRKAEKIRRNLSREQKRFAKAEAEAEAARLKVAALQKQAQGLPNGHAAHPNGPLEVNSQVNSEPSESPDVDTAPMGSTDAIKNAELSPENPPTEQSDLIDATADHLEDAMDLSADENSSDWTSSSGSDAGSDLDSGSGSGSDSDSDSEDSAPEEVSSRREGPERVPPPPREGKKPVCRHFVRNGQCNRGDKCKFSHDVAERGTKAKVVEKKERKGLLDALLDRQKEEEDRRAMEVISWLGQNGFLQATESLANGPPSDIPV